MSTRAVTWLVPLLAVAACTRAGRIGPPSAAPQSPSGAGEGRIAQIIYWRARPGKLEEYTRYVRDVAEPIDREAQRRGAFLSVTTYIARDTTTPWTHMRVFILRDSAQLARLSIELDSAGIRLHPDAEQRRQRGLYSATLRDRVGVDTVDILHR